MLTTLEMQCACLAVCLGSSFPARNPFLQFSAQVQGFSFLQAEAGSGGAVPWGFLSCCPRSVLVYALLVCDFNSVHMPLLTKLHSFPTLWRSNCRPE